MKQISFLLDGTGLSQGDIDTLDTRVKALSAAFSDHSLSFIIYSTHNTALTSSNPVIYFVEDSGTVAPLQKAVVAACGTYLVFTSFLNLVGDKQGEIIKSIPSTHHFGVALPVANRAIKKRTGVITVSHCPFLIVEKWFAVQNIASIADLKYITHTASRQLLFIMLPELTVNFPDALFGGMVTIRPYTRLIRNKIGDLKKCVKEKKHQRIAKRLRANVLDVPYNPNMPVFIICRDRLKPLLELVHWLEDEGLKNIILVDNASTYAPLVSYLDTTPYEVVRLASNVGHASPWSQGIVSLYAPNQPFIVTDPDVIPDKGAHGAVKLFCELLTEHPERTKVGFGLKIDDIPDSYDLKAHVVAWESQFWETAVEQDVYDAEIDTTFAVYRHNTPYTLGPALRTGGRFVARHDPWYIDSENVDEEIRYYREHADHSIGSWGIHKKDYTSKVYSRNASRKVS